MQVSEADIDVCLDADSRRPQRISLQMMAHFREG